MQIGLLGAGNLARALALGLGRPVFVFDPVRARAESLADACGGQALDSAKAVAERSDLLVLCHKPAQLTEVASEVNGAATHVLSVLGATPLPALREAYPAATVVRVMPNIAMEVGEGLTILCSPSGEDERGLAQQVRDLLEQVGGVVELDETLLPVAQGVSGGMPAYVAMFIEAYVDSLIRHGMTAETAAGIVSGSVAGAARLVGARSGDTLGVRRQVTSPGGSTARALRALEDGGLRRAVADSVDASIIR